MNSLFCGVSMYVHCAYVLQIMYIGTYFACVISISQVVSCLDDTNQSTRLVSCKVLQLLFIEKQHWNNGMYVNRVISAT